MILEKEKAVLSFQMETPIQECGLKILLMGLEIWYMLKKGEIYI